MKKYLILLIVLQAFTSCRSYYNNSGYNCVSGSCVDVDENPEYLTLSSCQSSCSNNNSAGGYNCQSGNCSYTSSNAQYSTYSDCQNACGSSNNTSGYNCISGTCTYVNSNAQYSSANECQAACAAANTKGQVILWRSLPEYGFGPANDTRDVCRVNNMHFTINGSNYTIFAGHYSSAPACGSSYCATISLAPGTYTVTGKCYFLKPLTGPDCPNYSVTKTFTVYKDQCTQVHFP